MTMQDGDSSFSRRTFLKGSSLAAVGGSLVAEPVGGEAPAAAGRLLGPGPVALELDVNGEKKKLEVETRTTLLEALRDQLDLTGSKQICDRGACGGCTVLADGVAINSCMMLALDAAGSKLVTVEGLSADGRLHPVQQAFVDCDALQCGFCTPGFVVAGVACLHQHQRPDLQTIQRELSGNLCRCGTYGRVCEAIQRAAKGGQR
jgi:aerobic-type carbon monoxide dehydrogenase small subunit (CoxS/CutS family)